MILAKWININPTLLIIDEPTRGIDVGAKAEIYRLMRQLAKQLCKIGQIFEFDI